MTDKESQGISNRRVRMANERTFLAWLRTSIGIMAFGFVVERFSFFLREISLVLGSSSNPPNNIPPSHGYAAIIGIVLVGLGTLMGVLAFFRYKNIDKQIVNDAYQPSLNLDYFLIVSIMAIGILLIAYLVYNFVTIQG